MTRVAQTSWNPTRWKVTCEVPGCRYTVTEGSYFWACKRRIWHAQTHHRKRVRLNPEQIKPGSFTPRRTK